MSPPAGRGQRERHRREPVNTYVVLHYHGRPLAGSAPPPGYVEAEPLGTVEARMAADAKAQAALRWPGVPPRAFRVRTARSADAGLLGAALARDARPPDRA